MTEKHFYEKNTELLESKVNKTFEEILAMDDKQFRNWVIDLRKTVVDLWDNKGLPPRVGYNEKEIIENFRDMVTYPVHELEIEKDVIRNTSVIGNAVNQWFPTMMKTKISYSAKGNAKSIYDYFADDKLLDTFVTYAKRHFKRDSFYHYSNPISYGEKVHKDLPPFIPESPLNFVDWFENKIRGKYPFDYWFCPVKEDKKYTGYNTALAKKENVLYKRPFFKPDLYEKQCVSNVTDENNMYSIRIYKKGQKLFPLGLKAFRVSFCQYAVNFPPLTARYLYERFTKHIPEDQRINIYDPSSGWGGRLLGAMAVSDRRTIHYVGTDPNTDHNIRYGQTKYHDIAEFFNTNIRENGSLFPKCHTYHIFQRGSETISDDPAFQQYKGKLDLVFTSPPYFSKEVYSNDKEQSCHKFKSYESWRDEFLRPTLTTAVQYLRSNRYLLWNIADIALDSQLLPLEQDSRTILEELGMVYDTTIKMTLAQMPGGNRMEDTGETEITTNMFGETEETTVVKGMMKNYIQITNEKGKKMMLKYEPIFVYRKP